MNREIGIYLDRLTILEALLSLILPQSEIFRGVAYQNQCFTSPNKMAADFLYSAPYSLRRLEEYNKL